MKRHASYSQKPAIKYLKSAYNVGRAVYRAYRRNKATKRIPYTSNRSTTLTTQHDVRTSSKVKKLSKKKKRQLVFDEKVQQSIARHKGLVSFLENSGNYFQNLETAPDNFGPDRQIIVDAADFRLGCFKSTAAQGIRQYIVEVNRSGRETEIADTTPISGTPMRRNINDKDFYMTSSKLNVAIENNSPYLQYIDIYECVTRCDISRTDYNTAQKAWDFQLSQSSAFNAATGTTAFTVTRQTSLVGGATPYLCPEFGKYWKILKKTRIQLGVQSFTNYTMTGYKGKIDFQEDLQDTLKAGKCKDLIIVSCPTFNPFASGDDNMLKYQVTKTYTIDWANAPGKDLGYAGYLPLP